MKTDYQKAIYEIRKEIENEIINLIKTNKDNFVKIPYYCEEDYIDDDVEQLIEDGYNVIIEDGFNGFNLNVQTINHCGYIQYIDIVALSINKFDVVEIIDKEQNIHILGDVSNLIELSNIYDILYDVINE
jgi:hypothetical protein